MVVLLHVSHFCCPLIYDYSPQTHELSEQSGFDDNGEGIEGLCSRKREQEKTAKGAEVGRGGVVGRYSLFISFHPCSSVRATCHYIQPTCISERQYKLSLVFILDRTVDTSKVTFPNLPSLRLRVLLFCGIKVIMYSPNAYQFRLITSQRFVGIFHFQFPLFQVGRRVLRKPAIVNRLQHNFRALIET